MFKKLRCAARTTSNVFFIDVQTDIVHDFPHGCLVPFIVAESGDSHASLMADRSPLGNSPRCYTGIKHPLDFQRYGLVALTDMATNSLLKIMVEKPAMMFGNRDGYLRDIEAFDIGYATATEAKRSFVPDAFKQYIIDTLAPNNPRESTWFRLIREHASGEKAEWDLFKRLWRDYEKRTYSLGGIRTP